MRFKKLLSFFKEEKDYDFTGSYTALEVAKHIITKCSIDDKLITNLQLQKILYYIQRYFLKNQKRALFSDEIEAWQFGPVVREVYDYFCGSGAMTIYYIQIGGSTIAEEDAAFIDKIVEEKRELNAWEMVRDTHKKGKPWDLVYRDGFGYKDVIPKRLIAENGW